MELADIILHVAKSTRNYGTRERTRHRGSRNRQNVWWVWGVGNLTAVMMVIILYFSFDKHCPFNCHFSSLIFTIHRQFPLLEEPFAAEASQNTMTGSERVPCIRNISGDDLQGHDRTCEKIWLGFQSMLRGFSRFMLKAYEMVTLAFSECVLLR